MNEFFWPQAQLYRGQQTVREYGSFFIFEMKIMKFLFISYSPMSLTLYPPMSSGVDICRSTAKNVKYKEFEIFKDTLCSTPQDLSISKKELFFSMCWRRDIPFIKQITLNKGNLFFKIFFLTLTNTYFDNVPCGISQTECQLMDHIGFNILKRIRQRRQG